MVANRKYFCEKCGQDNIKLDPQERMKGCPHCNASWSHLIFSNRISQEKKQEIKLKIQAEEFESDTNT